MRTPTTISKISDVHPTLDFNLLRKEGIKHFQRLAGHLWTDHNIHDPGITIWEHICYALTDLGYRMHVDIKDKLAYKDAESEEAFFSAASILSVAPVSLRDYRKLIIDVDGVRNAWLEPSNNQTPLYFDPEKSEIVTQRNRPDANSNLQDIQVKGLYKILIAGEGTGIEAEVSKRLHANRSLGMDFTAVTLMPKESIKLDIDIEIENIEDGIELLGEIYFHIDAYISPQISFYSLIELLEEGKKIEDIIHGPSLEHGFIKDEELTQFQRKTELRASDIIQAIMDVKGVAVVRNLFMISGNKREKWVLNLAENYTPEFQTLSSNIRFFKGGLEIQVDQNKAIAYMNFKKQAYANRLSGNQLYDRIIPEGRKRDLEAYESFQNHFPENYGIGERGLSGSESSKRKGQAKQLKAYLIFFEQILANLISQSANSAKLFAFNSDLNQSYYTQSIQDKVQASEDVLLNPGDYAQKLKEISESELDGLKRKKKILNHVLARFGEQFTEYSLLLFGAIESQNEEGASANELSIASLDVEARKAFLKEYPSLSAQRHLGINYTQSSSSGDEAKTSGLKRRISRLMGLTSSNASDIAYIGESFELNLESQVNGPDRYSWTFEKGDLRMESSQTYVNEELAHLSIQKFIQLASELDRYSITPAGRILRLRDEDNNNLAQKSNLQDTAAAEAFRDSIILYFQDDYPAASPEDFHLVEHILLRPVLGQDLPKSTEILLEKVPRKDPYSLQASFVLPNWVGRFKNEAFRTFSEQLIRQESPAYLSIFIHWMDWKQMASFESGYKQWLKVLANN